MIRSESEYKQALERLADERSRLETPRATLRGTGLSEAEIRRVTDPMESFHLQLREEVESFERLRRGEFGEFHNLQGIGQLLIGLRIAKGMTQRELAERLGVHESQISRDERNEYHGVTLDRASRVLEVLGAEIRTTVVDMGPSERASVA
jgi:DNA-binding XRE family transcriptional regulator